MTPIEENPKPDDRNVLDRDMPLTPSGTVDGRAPAFARLEAYRKGFQELEEPKSEKLREQCKRDVEQDLELALLLLEDPDLREQSDGNVRTLAHHAVRKHTEVALQVVDDPELGRETFGTHMPLVVTAVHSHEEAALAVLDDRDLALTPAGDGYPPVAMEAVRYFRAPALKAVRDPEYRALTHQGSGSATRSLLEDSIVPGRAHDLIRALEDDALDDDAWAVVVDALARARPELLDDAVEGGRIALAGRDPEDLLPLLQSDRPEVREQTLRALGEGPPRKDGRDVRDEPSAEEDGRVSVDERDQDEWNAPREHSSGEASERGWSSGSTRDRLLHRVEEAEPEVPDYHERMEEKRNDPAIRFKL